MIPPIESHVKILLRNNATVEGIVKEWSTEVIKLQSLDDQSYIIIPNPAQDIILIKVFLERPAEEKTEIKTKLEQRFQQMMEQPSDNPIRNKSLAELKILLSEQDKQIVANKLKNHYPNEAKKVEYGYPRFLSKPSTK